MTEEATPTGAEINTTAPDSIDAAAQKLNGLFKDDPEDKKVKKEEEASEEAPEEPTEEGETETETEVVEESEEPETEAEDKTSEPLTTLSSLAEKLGLDETSLYDVKLKTKIDGVDGEATLAQLVKSYQLEGHLNRKNMEVSDLKKEVEKEKESIEGYRQQRLSDVEAAANIANQLLAGEFQSIDWEKLRREDSIGYLEKKAQFEEYQQGLHRIASVIQQEQQKVQKDSQERLQKYIEDQRTQLINSVPEWKDKAVLKREYGELIGFLRDDFNVSNEDIGQILDHRFYLLARDAKRYRDLQKKNPRIENKDRKPQSFVKAGTPKGQAERTTAQVSELKKNFSKQRDEKSAAQLINALSKKVSK